MIIQKNKMFAKTEGAIGIFTNGSINRVEMFTHIARMLIGQYCYQKGK